MHFTPARRYIDAAAANSSEDKGLFGVNRGLKWIVVIGPLLNQSWQHIADARIRSQAQGRFLTFRSVGYNIGCRSPLSNCNQCARIDFSSCHPLGNPFRFIVQKSFL
jgi:hypothetical protein